MDGKYHTVLTRHLQKYWQGEPITPKLEALLKAIDQSFSYYERDRELLDRAMELSSQELNEAYQQISKELEQKHVVHERLKESEQLLKSLTSNLSEAVFRRKVGGKLVFVNKAFLTLFGYATSNEIMEVPRNDFYVDPETSIALIDTISKNEAVKSVEILFKKKDESQFWGLASSTFSTDAHGNQYVDGAIVDISELKRTEESLRRANEKLKKTNEELDRFVYSASHDLRAPLMSILGLINLMKIEKVKDNSEHLELMQKSILKLDHFVKDIIDYSYNARTSVQSEQIDFKEMLDQTFEQFEYMDPTHSIHKIIDLSIDEPFWSDAKRLKVIFSNLISNSIRYYNHFESRPFIKVAARTSANCCRIQVTDNGIGIDPAHQGKIFEMFYRATADNNGSGLGLYIVKETIDKLNGSIEFDSAVGQGTTFSIKVPNTKK